MRCAFRLAGCTWWANSRRRCCVWGRTATPWRCIPIWRSCVTWRGTGAFAASNSNRRSGVSGRLTFARDAVVLGVAHVLRRACMNRRTITDVEASGLAHVLAERLVTLQHGEAPRSPAPQQLSRQTIDKLAEFIEAGLTQPPDPRGAGARGGTQSLSLRQVLQGHDGPCATSVRARAPHRTCETPDHDDAIGRYRRLPGRSASKTSATSGDSSPRRSASCPGRFAAQRAGLAPRAPASGVVVISRAGRPLVGPRNWCRKAVVGTTGSVDTVH